MLLFSKNVQGSSLKTERCDEERNVPPKVESCCSSVASSSHSDGWSASCNGLDNGAVPFITVRLTFKAFIVVFRLISLLCFIFFCLSLEKLSDSKIRRGGRLPSRIIPYAGM